MKTTFSRVFFPAFTVLVGALCLVGLAFLLLAKSYTEARAMDRLQTCGKTVANVAAAYYAEGTGSETDFYINLSVASETAGADVVICDRAGKLVLCSDSPLGCPHQGLVVSPDYLTRVVSAGSARDTGVVRGLYTDNRYVVSVPIYDAGAKVVGIVMASAPMADTLLVLSSMTRIYFYVALLVIILALVIMSVLARRSSRPLQELSRTATAFGHGDLDARVKVDPDTPVEIQELALSFNNMASSLQKSEYQRQEFVANVSHELKTPMTTISGFMDGILDGTIPPERQKHYMQLVSDETKRLSRLVRSMLDISRLQDQGGIPEEKKTRFDLTECAGQVLITFEQKITAKKLNVQVDMPEHPVYTRANADYITQVIYNLLDNAVKFCPEGGDLGLRLRFSGSKIYMGISNSGKTIPPEELPLVFDRFHKLDKSRTENRDGWGLGLYIVKTIVCSHGEDISVASAGGRTEFTFTLPLVN